MSPRDYLKRFQSLKSLLSQIGCSHFVPPPFEPDYEENLTALLTDRKVLVVGAGGLGCELLKDLALSGFGQLEVIDIDTIELSNLNRQFLFRQTDIGKSKAQVAAEFVQNRCDHVSIQWHCKKIQEFPPSYFKEFFLIIAGLDNVQARRYLNSMVHDLLEYDQDGTLDPTSIIPLIDGGTEGFKGQTRLFFPGITSCYECSLGTLPKQKTVAMCTIASVPRRPEHCIAYALEIEWPTLCSFVSAHNYEIGAVQDERQRPDLDTDNVQHMTWLYERAVARANEYQIQGVTYSKTMQVVKNIIPAIASTNALISATCVLEAMKYATWCSLQLNNYLMYMGHTGIYSTTIVYEKNPNCLVCCRNSSIGMKVPRTITLNQFLQHLMEHPQLNLKNPAVLTQEMKPLYLSGQAVKARYQSNLRKQLVLFVQEKDELITQLDLLILDKQTLGDRTIELRLTLE